MRERRIRISPQYVCHSVVIYYYISVSVWFKTPNVSVVRKNECLREKGILQILQ